jgi:hypothetical protein
MVMAGGSCRIRTKGALLPLSLLRETEPRHVEVRKLNPMFLRVYEMIDEARGERQAASMECDCREAMLCRYLMLAASRILD